MLLDAREIANGTTLSTDLCIIGAGAAGITLATELRNSGLDILLLEGGGLESDDTTQELYEGQAIGTLLRTRPSYLTQSRLRYFGGTTNHWAGWCRPLDPLDFAVREWVPRSGWPFDRAHLDPYYERAATFCEVSAFRREDESALLQTRHAFRLGQRQLFETKMFYLSPPTRFGEAYRDGLKESPHVRTILHANVTKLRCNSAGTRIEALLIQTREGKRIHVRPRTCVLAAGAIENARLLLCSNDVVNVGIGNEFGMVGRCFVDHPHIKAGFLLLNPTSEVTGAGILTPDFMAAYEERRTPPLASHRTVGLLCTTEQAQREHKLLNFTATVHRRPYHQVSPSQGAVADISVAMDLLDGDRYPRSRESLAYLGLLARVEQGPNPENRVELSNEVDELGMPKVLLTWNVSESDRESLQRTLELLGRELGQAGQGRSQSLLHEERVWRSAGGGSHHVGTIRMHTDPREGPLTPDCQVRGVDNLYVAGSAVFPTSGAANPTFTIVALALRLADHLGSRLSPGVGGA